MYRTKNVWRDTAGETALYLSHEAPAGTALPVTSLPLSVGFPLSAETHLHLLHVLKPLTPFHVPSPAADLASHLIKERQLSWAHCLS
jgi:hypothetical protein